MVPLSMTDRVTSDPISRSRHFWSWI